MTIELNGEPVELRGRGDRSPSAVERAGAEPGAAASRSPSTARSCRAARGTDAARDGQRVEVVGAIQGG